jgi:hypothetical protein
MVAFKKMRDCSKLDLSLIFAFSEKFFLIFREDQQSIALDLRLPIDRMRNSSFSIGFLLFFSFCLLKSDGAASTTAK